MSNRRPILQPNELSNDAVTSMRTRVIAALAGIAVVVPFIIFGDWPFFALMVLVLVFAIIEIIRCAKTKYSKVLYAVALLLAFLVLLWNVLQDLPTLIRDNSWDTWRIFDSYNRLSVSVTIMFIGMALLTLTVLVDKNFTIIDACFIFMTVVLISLGVESFLFLRFFPVHLHHLELARLNQTVPYINSYDNLGSFFFVFYMCLGACLNDAFAYFVGVFFGKHKMNPRISPKKTWEGFFGGVILTAAFLCGYAFIFAGTGHPLLKGLLDINRWYHIVILSILIPLVSTLGDLFFSSIKRHYQIKDFSNLIPGHGGILDRLDSLMFAAITMAIYASIFTDQSVFTGIANSGGISLP